ncbi:MAG TPA: DUF624 domain-containing protein [Mobilitalea sp.]|nr:DUF624 domain-containing protein [Mobilitalea sp.]
MGNLFNVDNPFFAFLSKLCDMFFLSVIWILLCIPVITIGPANTAMYYAAVKVIRRERGYLTREFFKSFKMNFKRGAIMGVILTIIYIVLGYDLIWSWGMLNAHSKYGSIMFGVFIAITFLVLCYSIYAYPILSRFDMTLKQLFKAASFMSMRHLPFTLGMAILTVAAGAVLILIPISIFIVPALVTVLNSLLMERVLKKYMPEKSEENPDETRKDEWYLE